MTTTLFKGTSSGLLDSDRDGDEDGWIIESDLKAEESHLLKPAAAPEGERDDPTDWGSLPVDIVLHLLNPCRDWR